MGATEVVIVESEILARKEQAAIKKRIRRTAEQVKRTARPSSSLSRIKNDGRCSVFRTKP